MTKLLLILAAIVWFLSPSCAFGQSHAHVFGALDVSALQPGKPAHLAIVMDIDNGYHAQSNTPTDDSAIKCELTLDDIPGIDFGEITYPQGKTENYPQLGKLNVYTGRAIILVTVKPKADAPKGDLKLSGKVELQICDDNSCFPPSKLPVSLETKIVSADTPVTAKNAALFTAPPATQPAKN